MGYADLLNEYIYSFSFGSNPPCWLLPQPGTFAVVSFCFIFIIILFKIAVGVIKVEKDKKEKNVKFVDF